MRNAREIWETAARLRRQALETALPGYPDKMRAAAGEIEAAVCALCAGPAESLCGDPAARCPRAGTLTLPAPAIELEARPPNRAPKSGRIAAR